MGYYCVLPPAAHSLAIQLGDTLLLLLCAMYLDAVLAGPHGSPSHPLFCCGYRHQNHGTKLKLKPKVVVAGVDAAAKQQQPAAAAAAAAAAVQQQQRLGLLAVSGDTTAAPAVASNTGGSVAGAPSSSSPNSNAITDVGVLAEELLAESARTLSANVLRGGFASEQPGSAASEQNTSKRGRSGTASGTPIVLRVSHLKVVYRKGWASFVYAFTGRDDDPDTAAASSCSSVFGGAAVNRVCLALASASRRVCCRAAADDRTRAKSSYGVALSGSGGSSRYQRIGSDADAAIDATGAHSTTSTSDVSAGGGTSSRFVGNHSSSGSASCGRRYPRLAAACASCFGWRQRRRAKAARTSTAAASSGSGGGDIVVAVNDLSLTLRRGEILGILGHNGCGKTSTISVLTGLFTASGGVAEVCGYDVVSNISEVQKVMGVCPQQDLLWPQLTAWETLDLFAAIKGVAAGPARVAEVMRVLHEVRLGPVAHRAVGTFSGGMKRRVSVAIAALGSPSVIFLDEPTTGMDPVNRLQVWRLIQRLKKTASIILTTHNMDEVNVLGEPRCCARISVLCAYSLYAPQGPTTPYLQLQLARQSLICSQLQLAPPQVTAWPSWPGVDCTPLARPSG